MSQSQSHARMVAVNVDSERSAAPAPSTGATIVYNARPADDDDEAAAKARRDAKRGSLGAALLYIGTAVALVLFNKNVLGGMYTLRAPALVPLVQQVIIGLGLRALHASGAIRPLPELSQRTLGAMLPVSVAFVFYLVLGMAAISRVSIPMYASLRRFTVVFVMLFDYAIAGRTHSLAVGGTVALQVAGCVLAAVRDVEYNPSGYAYIALYNTATAVYLVVIKHVKTEHPFLDSFGMMYLNAVMLTPVLTVLSWLFGDVDALLAYEHNTEFAFLLSFTASALLAFVLNYAIFWNTSANSALTQTVSGQIKDIGTVLLGYIFFPPPVYDMLNMFGVLLGFVGSLSYAAVKLHESNNAKR